MNRTVAALSVLIEALALPGVLAAGDQTTRPAERNAATRGADGATALRLAFSADGRSLSGEVRPFCTAAAAPDLLRLERGVLLAVFDLQVRAGAKVRWIMAVSRSDDDGQTWSPPRRVIVRDRAGREVTGLHGDWQRLPDGRARLFFAQDEPAAGSRPADASAGRRGVLIRSALTRDGLTFEADGAPICRVEGEPDDDLHPTVADHRGETHVFAGPARLPERRAAGSAPRLLHFTSADGRTFVERRRVEPLPFALGGGVLSGGRDLVAYVSVPAGVRCALSTDGGTWKVAGETVIRGAWDAAVERTANGFVFLYTTHADSRDQERVPLVVASLPAYAGVDRAEQRRRGQPRSEPDEPSGDDPSGELISEDSLVRSEAGVPWEPFGGAEGAIGEAERQAGSPVGQVRGPSEDGAAQAGQFDAGETADGDAAAFPPMPDFVTRIDYFAWYREHVHGQVADNAYDAYAAFMPEPGKSADSAGWPTFAAMFNNADFTGPPRPWDPAEQPEWEASNQQVQGLLAQFRAATLHAGYAHRGQVSDEFVAATPGNEPLLLGIPLPQLSFHRTLAKATLSDAWRAEGGVVSAERMAAAIETTLRGAAHMRQGTTLIEELVGVAEQAFAEENARWALKQGVFSTEQAESVLQTLIEHDTPGPPPERSLMGEYAITMDATQYVFMPRDGGPPRADPDRARYLLSSAGEPVDVEQVVNMTPADVRTTLEAFDNYYRELGEQMRIGYPQVRGADVDATSQKYVATSPMTQVFLPALSRVHRLRARNDASRRATQLAYAVHIYKDQTGRWPATLDELPASYGATMRTDPFTGGFFGYRVTESGPTIYSLSENGLDDGGVHAPRWDDEPVNGSDDHVFWPPQARP